MVIANEFDNTIAPDYVMMPILLGLIGYVASVIGVFSMSFLKNGSDPAAAALRNATFIGALLFWAGGYGAIQFDLIAVNFAVMHAVVLGSVIGILIGLVSPNTTPASSPCSVSRPRPSLTSVRCPRPDPPPTPSPGFRWA